MHCGRCLGLMVSHKLDAMWPATSSWSPLAWKCFLCSDVIDAVVAANGPEYGKPSRDPIGTPYLAWACRSRHKGRNG